MGFERTAQLISLAQTMTNSDAIDFIEDNVSTDDIAAWLAALDEPKEIPLFSAFGVTRGGD